MAARSVDPRGRRFWIKGAALLALPALMPLRAIAAKIAKSEVKYQDKPKAGKDCDDCMHFVPGPSAKAPGTCKVVEGAVSPHGYCIAFTPKARQG
jgi:hypothetical protein